MPDPSAIHSLAVVALFVAYAANTAWDRLKRDPDPVDEATRAYESGKIDLEEYESRLEFHLDDRNEQIRRVVEDVNGVGEATSKAIAEEFDSLNELRSADQEELEDVHGVGEKTAEAVLERV